ncbi:MAG: FAD-dependent oxidoreductase [Candidatus Sericytochromatia bacterium]|nr:FAD-dependent oxidoreductase [Candidatus Tanganyikabacteria bacterium]
MSDRTFQADVVVAGGGLAGIVTAFELLEHGKSVVLIDKDTQDRFGGLARESFGALHLIGTTHQRRMGIADSADLAFRDWERVAHWGPEDEWPRRWARLYCDRSLDLIAAFVEQKGVQFLPMVNWAERGLLQPANSVPRFHIAWGTGHEIVHRVVLALDAHPRRESLQVVFDAEVSEVEVTAGRATAVVGRFMDGSGTFRAAGEHIVIASGGICGGDMSKLRANWYKPWGEPPKILLNGAHRYADGLLHDKVAALGANVTHLDKQWHYAAGVFHPAKRRPYDGLSLVPPRSALWLNALGERIGPMPLVGYTDTRYLVESILRQPGQYTWQVLNRKIALKELAVSGCDFMTAFRYKKKLLLLENLAFGDKALVDRLIAECPDDFVVGQTLPDLVAGMNRRGLDGLQVNLETVQAAIAEYDAQIDRGEVYFTDEQLRRLQHFRRYRADRLRLCKNQKILDPAAGPLIAIREFILARKSMGGIQTDMQCRALRADGTPLPGLYAVGEAAGFGGGGIHGLGSLEGTFLGSCILTGRVAGRAIAGAPS